MKTITAKYPGTCRKTGKPIRPGDVIHFYGRGHAELAEPGAVPQDTSTTQASRPKSSRGSRYTRFSSGAEVYTNRNGRCEDAPCCGCCS